MKKLFSKIRQRRIARNGFTLIELLVSVTLVLLMMTMFVAIFDMATGSVSTQKGIARNDQRSRALTNILRSDVAKRTFRYVQPFRPTEDSALSATSFGDRSGYLYISTNDPSSHLDDVLQFTVNAGATRENTDDSDYFGASKMLYDWQGDPAFPAYTDTERFTALRSNPNQPEADDSNMNPNGVSSSAFAEVCYFVRNGSLYRRTMLIREPLSVNGEDLSVEPETTLTTTPFVSQILTGSPEYGGGIAYVGSPGNIEIFDAGDSLHFALADSDGAPALWNVTATNDFWRHFDFSAAPNLVAGLPDGLTFMGVNSLSNEGDTDGVLGNPENRFGFNAVSGFSREHDNLSSLYFIGRFLHAETSHHYFNWPLAASRIENDEDFGTLDFSDFTSGSSFLGHDGSGTPGTGNGNPMDLGGTQLTLNQSTGIIEELRGDSGRGGVRKVEDLLLSNVHEFSVEVWDDRLERYVAPAHGFSTQFPDSGGTSVETEGTYHVNRRLVPEYGPLGAVDTDMNNVFDTWNPNVWIDRDSGGDMDFKEMTPPFMPYRYYPPRRTDSPPGPSPDTMSDPSLEVDPETGVASNEGYWQPSDFSDSDPLMWIYQNYSVGDVVFAVPEEFVVAGDDGWDADGDGEFDWALDQETADGEFPSQGFDIAYRCVVAGYAGATPPSFPDTPGQVFDDVADVSASGDPAQWVAVDNRRPLRSIQVTVKFFDQGTEKLKQLKLVLPLTTDR